MEIEELFHRAAECDPQDRTALLDQACVDDPGLRREVEALLSCQGSAGNHLQATVCAELDSLSFSLAGATVSHYRILEGLGAGGMGLVYRAEDMKLRRQVALKFLPEESAKDPIALARFEREARAISAVEHPNICPIYEFGEHKGKRFLVMQLLEGQTMKQLLETDKLETSNLDSRVTSRGGVPLALDQVLDLSIQIADGLGAAHQKGIIHRDIKPANIFVTSQGQAKILDFGLAKHARPEKATAGDLESDRRDEGVGEPASATAHLTTRGPLASRTGVAMGTAGYMSPEQARGEKLDSRTDLFSFGLLIYEMATAQRAFSGDTGPELYNAILMQTPTPVRELNPQVPVKLERIVNRAIEKAREARYQNVSEIRADLDALKRDIGPRRQLQRWILSCTAVVLFFVVGGMLWLTRRQPSSAKVLPEIRFRQLTINSPDNPVRSGSISHDGKYLAYVDTTGMHVKDIETGALQVIPPPEDLKSDTRDWEIIDAGWFPDSTRFLANAHPAKEGREEWSSRSASIWIFSRLGRAPQKVRDHAIAWSISPNGSLISYATNSGRGGEREIWLMTPDGEQARKLFDTDEDSSVAATFWQPDGRHVLFVRTDGSGDAVLSRDLIGGSPTTVFAPPEAKQERGDIVWLPDGRLIYQVADPDYELPSAQEACNFWTLKLDALTGKPIEKPKRLTNWTGFCISSANVTADGKRLAFLKLSGSHVTTYMADLAAGGTRILSQRHFTLNESDDFIVDWTADSKTAIIGHNRGDHYELYKQSLSGNAPEPIVTAASGVIENYAVSPDGKWVIVQVWPASGGPSRRVPIVRVPLTGGSPEQLFQVREGSLISCSKAPSNLCTVAEQSDDRKEMTITAFDPLKGRGHELARFEIDPDIDLSRYLQGHVSPDGTHVLALRGQKGPIEIRSLRGGPAQVVHPKGLNNMLIVSWAADGNGLFVTNGTQNGSDLLHLDLRGNTTLLWKSLSLERRCGGVPSPDGHHLAIYDLQQSANMWMMENF